ncbi:hypothetical protein L9F63_024622, partial [Diploptera punctata]
MGHAEGICHVYVDSEADFDKAFKINPILSDKANIVGLDAVFTLDFKFLKNKCAQ